MSFPVRLRFPSAMLAFACGAWLTLCLPASAAPMFRAGAATANITPPLGVSINGGMQDRAASHVHDELHARALVLDDGATRLAIVVNDSCMIPREVFDDVRADVSRRTGIPPGNLLFSATHTHTAPSSASVFQSNADYEYRRFLARRIADAVRIAANRLEPAELGHGACDVPQHVFNRRWHLKPGTAIPNPFGGQDRVKMNPGNQNPVLERPAGPVDPQVCFLAVRARDGRWISVLANYSLHYVGGVGGISADYFGAFAVALETKLGAARLDPPFVGIMANGTSGDINNINFAAPRPKRGDYEQIRIVARDVAAAVAGAMPDVSFRRDVPLAAATRELTLAVRKPAPEEIARAEAIASRAKQFPRMDTPDEIYARETLQMQAYPERVQLMLQALRIGDFAVTAIPCEVFVEIGLELKRRNPFPASFTVSLANGYNGYLPTPEHHALGGYETWRAKSSYLETNASVHIVGSLMDCLGELKR